MVDEVDAEAGIAVAFVTDDGTDNTGVNSDGVTVVVVGNWEEISVAVTDGSEGADIGVENSPERESNGGGNTADKDDPGGGTDGEGEVTVEGPANEQGWSIKHLLFLPL